MESFPLMENPSLVIHLVSTWAMVGKSIPSATKLCISVDISSHVFPFGTVSANHAKVSPKESTR